MTSLPIDPVKAIPDYLAPHPSGKRGFKLGFRELAKHFPVERLPSCLLPKAKIVPPLFLYGYLVTEQEIEAFATKHNLLELTGMIPDDIPDGIELTEEYYDNLPTQMVPALTGENILDFITKEYDIRSFRMRFGCVRSATTPKFIFFLTTNWNLGKPLKEEIEKVRKVFGWEGPPKWHASIEDCYWGATPTKRYC